MPRMFNLLVDYRATGGGLVLPPTPPPTNHGTDIGNYVEQPGAQTVTVANGTYTARRVSAAAHAAELVLVAETQGQVIVDMSPPGTALGGGLTAQGDLILDGTTSNVKFVGFKFINGTVRIDGNTTDTSNPQPPTNRHIVFWYCEHTFPYTVWVAEPGWPDSQYHNGCRTFDIGQNPDQMFMYGGNHHDTGTGIIYRPPNASGGVTQQQRLTVVGSKFTTMTDGGNNPFDPYDIVHPTCISCVAGVNGVTVTDCLLYPGSGIALSGHAGGALNFSNDTYRSATNITLARLWVRDMAYFTFNSDAPYRAVSVDASDIYTWNGIDLISSVHAYDSSFDWIEQYTDASGIHTGGLGFGAGHGVTISNRANLHIGVDPGGGNDPATAWQLANPYSSYTTFSFP